MKKLGLNTLIFAETAMLSTFGITALDKINELYLAALATICALVAGKIIKDYKTEKNGGQS